MSNKFLYCKWCMQEHAVFPMQGHKKDFMDLGCSNCNKQIARLKLNEHGEWELDGTFYSENK